MRVLGMSSFGRATWLVLLEKFSSFDSFVKESLIPRITADSSFSSYPEDNIHQPRYQSSAMNMSEVSLLRHLGCFFFDSTVS